jgi:hypothetical protein
VKPNTNLVEVHPQPSQDGFPVDGALVGAGSLSHLGSGPYGKFKPGKVRNVQRSSQKMEFRVSSITC